MPSGDPHNYGQCWCGRDHHQSIWQDGYDAGLLAATKSPSDAPLDVERLRKADDAWWEYVNRDERSAFTTDERIAFIAREYAASGD